jgi:hypothetical protein
VKDGLRFRANDPTHRRGAMDGAPGTRLVSRVDVVVSFFAAT